MAEDDNNYVEAPKSRLDANTIAKSRAFDARRRAATVQRQQMGTERTLQRKYRTAVRTNDLQAISVYGGELDRLNVPKGGGGGIQSAKENDLIAQRRADLLMQAGNQMGSNFAKMNDADGQRNNQNAQQQENSEAIEEGANNNRRGAQSNQDNQGTFTGPRDSEKIFGSDFEGPKTRYIQDLKTSPSIRDSSNPEKKQAAIDRAKKAGAQFDISGDQIDAFLAGKPAKKSDVIAPRARELTFEEQLESYNDRYKSPEALKAVEDERNRKLENANKNTFLDIGREAIADYKKEQANLPPKTKTIDPDENFIKEGERISDLANPYIGLTQEEKKDPKNRQMVDLLGWKYNKFMNQGASNFRNMSRVLEDPEKMDDVIGEVNNYYNSIQNQDKNYLNSGEYQINQRYEQILRKRYPIAYQLLDSKIEKYRESIKEEKENKKAAEDAQSTTFHLFGNKNLA